MAIPDPAGRLCPEISGSDSHEATNEIQGYLDITPSDPKEICRHAFRHARERISRVPVIGGFGRLAGIVSCADILRAQSAPPE